MVKKKEMAKSMTWKMSLLMVGFIITVLLSLKSHKIEPEENRISFFLQRQSASFYDELNGLRYDFYRHSCPQAESIVSSTMSRLYSSQKSVPANLLRLFFHDCFIKGCDASVLLDDSYGNKNHSTERQAIPNKSLKGFDKVDQIKERLEKACPGVVSCADTLALATRDGIVLSGGPFYPVFTGRRDSTRSYYREANAEIPNPNDNINQLLHLFADRGFDERETVSLLGAHNVGKISCDFIQNRLENFAGTGHPDNSMASDFIDELRLSCQGGNGTTQQSVSTPTIASEEGNSTSSAMIFFEELSASISSGAGFDAHYYQNLLRKRGLLYADQQLMADQNTARFVQVYASDDGTTFRRAFARSMLKMSNLDVLTGSQGQVRIKCSLPRGRS